MKVYTYSGNVYSSFDKAFNRLQKDMEEMKKKGYKFREIQDSRFLKRFDIHHPKFLCVYDLEIAKRKFCKCNQAWFTPRTNK